MAPFEREIVDLKELFKPEEIEKGYQWCQDKGLMPKYCPDCNEVLELSSRIKDDTCLGYCSSCQSTCNALAGTWFEIAGMEPWSAIALLFYWSVGYSYPQAASRLNLTAADARAAYAKCVRFSEEAMALCKDELYVDAPPHHYLEHQHQTCPFFKIGGKGKKVEVGIVGKNQLVKDHFAVIGAEVGTWRCFLVPTPIVNAQVLDYVMHERIREGSIVYHPLSLYHGGERPQYLPQVFLPENTAVASTAERKYEVDHVEKLRDEMRANVPELLSAWDYHVFVVQYMYNRKYWFSPTESFRRVLEHIAQIYQKRPEMSL